MISWVSIPTVWRGSLGGGALAVPIPQFSVTASTNCYMPTFSWFGAFLPCSALDSGRNEIGSTHLGETINNQRRLKRKRLPLA